MTRSVDQQPTPSPRTSPKGKGGTERAMAMIAARPEVFRRQGTVVASWRQRGEKTYGPYYRLCWREDGRQRSVYLGRGEDAGTQESPHPTPLPKGEGTVRGNPLTKGEGTRIEDVRRALAELQRPLRERRAAERLRRLVVRSLRIQKIRLNFQLRPLGLRLKGFEVRGWQTSLLRPLLARPWRLPSVPRVPRLDKPANPVTDLAVDIAYRELVRRAGEAAEREIG
jgi:hypothetical protein